MILFEYSIKMADKSCILKHRLKMADILERTTASDDS